MLKTKSILLSRNYSDGTRISIMSRHTLNDGPTSDSRITESSFDKWGKEFAPPQKLIGDYSKRNLPWEEFEKRYLNYLETIYQKVKGLSEIALCEDITLLCIEDSPEKCHRRLLAEKCKRIKPRLEILIN